MPKLDHRDVASCSSGPGWTVAVDGFLSARSFSAGTRRSYRLTLDAVGRLVGPEAAVAGLDARDLVDVHATLYGERAPATWNRTRATVESFLRWLGRQEWIAREVAERFAELVERRHVPDGPPKAVEYVVLERLWTRKDVPLRERALWRMLYDTAARAEEVLQLDVGNLDLAERQALTTRKGGHQDVLAWTTGTARLLPRLLDGRRSGPVFLASQPAHVSRQPPLCDLDPMTGLPRLSYRRAEELFTEYSGGLTLHQLRHSSIVDLLEAGYDTPLVRAKSGHRSLRSFAVYARPRTRAVAAMTEQLDASRRGR